MNKLNIGDMVENIVWIHASRIGIVTALLRHSLVEVLWVNGDRRSEWTDNLQKVSYIQPCQGEVNYE